MHDELILSPEDYAELEQQLLLQGHGRRKRKTSVILVQKRLRNAQASKPEGHKEAPTERGSQRE